MSRPKRDKDGAEESQSKQTKRSRPLAFRNDVSPALLEQSFYTETEIISATLGISAGGSLCLALAGTRTSFSTVEPAVRLRLIQFAGLAKNWLRCRNMALLKYTVDDQEKMFLYLIELDCKKHHDHKNGLCQEHQKLADYVSKKIEGCPYDRTRRICTIHDLS